MSTTRVRSSFLSSFDTCGPTPFKTSTSANNGLRISGRICRHCEEQSDEAIQQPRLDCFATLAMTMDADYMRPMPSDPDLKRLHWRAHHRGTREADMLVGGFFDAHHLAWDSRECALFAAMLDEQDV